MKTLPSPSFLLIRALPLLFLAGVLTPLSASAFIFGVDFGQISSPTVVETGFQPFDISTGSNSGPISMTYSGVDASLTSGTLVFTVNSGTDLTSTSTTSLLTARNRTTNATLVDSGAFTYAELYTGFIGTTGSSAAPSMTLGVSGLNANTQYSVTLYADDPAATAARTMTFTNYTTGTAGVSGSVAYASGQTFSSSTSNDIYAVTLLVTSDASGNIVIRDTANNNTPAISAITISAVAVPEPGTTALIGLSAAFAGGCFVLRRFRLA